MNSAMSSMRLVNSANTPCMRSLLLSHDVTPVQCTTHRVVDGRRRPSIVVASVKCTSGRLFSFLLQPSYPSSFYFSLPIVSFMGFLIFSGWHDVRAVQPPRRYRDTVRSFLVLCLRVLSSVIRSSLFFSYLFLVIKDCFHHPPYARGDQQVGHFG
jgi:hypothetical protein